jgi:uncharacterized membrane protein YedE/YeeE
MIKENVKTFGIMFFLFIIFVVGIFLIAFPFNHTEQNGKYKYSKDGTFPNTDINKLNEEGKGMAIGGIIILLSFTFISYFIK